MSNQASRNCMCTEDRYFPECPRLLFKDGKVHHVEDQTSRLEQASHRPATPPEAPGDQTEGMAGTIAMLETELSALKLEHHRNEQVRTQMEDKALMDRHQAMQMRVSPQALQELSNPDAGTGYIADESLGVNRGNSQHRFAPLRVNGVTATEAIIGGYQLDIREMRDQIREYAALPSVCLPQIFKDTSLNFLHQFFMGLEVLAGRRFVHDVASKGLYFRSDECCILPLIRAVIREGYKAGDLELSIFVKRVLVATFEEPAQATAGTETEWLRVKANFLGFHYIEIGMQCKDSDLKMWLHSAYTQYRLAWFSVFKSSGLPEFAIDGVQERYETGMTHDPGRTRAYPVASEAPTLYKKQETSPERRDKHRRRREKPLRKDSESISQALEQWVMKSKGRSHP